jgi:2'-5' RNA ligase
MGNESAIILPVPEAEPIVGQLRLQYDPAARLGVPAHVTLLYPFCPAHTAEGQVDALRDACATIQGFRFSLIEVRRFPATAYLHPDQAEKLAQITRTLVNIWPAFSPYAGVHPDIIPHLTVADRVSAETLREVEACLRDQLPIPCVAREVWLITSDEAGLWSRRAILPLAAAS